MDEINDDSAQPIFRAAKRRRVWRKRTSDEEEEETGSASVVQEPTLQSPNGMRDDGENGTGQERQSAEDVAALALLRRQRLAKVRRPGIGFSKNTNVTSQEEQVVEVPEKSGTTAIAQAQGRFVPQMGMMTQETIENCERHMASYVDSKLAKMNGGLRSSETGPSQALGDLRAHAPSPVAGSTQKPATEFEALQEVDLGPEAILQNIARTEAARRKLAAGEQFDSDSESTRKIKLGRDGKPRKNRNRRDSADMRRDQMVEQLMRGTQLGIFQEQESSKEHDDGEATDDRVAAQFWQEYMDQVNYRNMRKAASNAPGPAGKNAKVDPTQKGPKLGGSRSARAAMKAQEDKAAKKS